MCDNILHSQSLNRYVNDVTDACISAAEASIPHTGSRSNIRGRIPGWSEHVQPLRDKSMFWHKMWLDCGRPRLGAVADSMRRTRAAYRYAIRNVKRNEDAIVRERLADAVLDNEARNFLGRD